MKRAITLAILIILNFCLQTTVFGFHDVNSIAPNLMLIMTMSFGLMRGRREGLLVGFFCGFLTDVFFCSILGPYMFLYMIIGYVNGFFHKNYMIEDVLLPLIVIIVDEFVFDCAIYFVSFFLHNKLEFGHFFKKIIFPEMLGTVFMTIVVYKIYVLINRYLKMLEQRKAKR